MPWSVVVPLHTLKRGPVDLTLVPDADERAEAAMQLGLPAIETFSGEATVRPWLDGAEVRATWRARVVQTCGVSLELFPTDFTGEFTVRAVPTGSPNAPSEDPEVIVDLDSDDPPDVLAEPEVDVAAYLVEHLALELDPFPRAPGVEFDAPEAENPASPFAVLSDYRRR